MENPISRDELSSPRTSLTSPLLQVELGRLGLDSFGWLPDARRLSAQVADVIADNISRLPPGEEVLIAKISGFPGSSEIDEGDTDAAKATEGIKRCAPGMISDMLKSRGITARVFHYEDSQLIDADVTVMVRQEFVSGANVPVTMQYFVRAIPHTREPRIRDLIMHFLRRIGG